MRILLINVLIFVSVIVPGHAFCQNSEKVSFDAKDSTAGYYLAIRPQSKEIKGVIVLLSSFMKPEMVLPETKLHNVAFANDMLTVVAFMNQRLYADDNSVSRLNTIIKDVVTRFSADTGKFVLGGFEEAGNIALRYTELAYEHPENFPVKPKAVFGIDAPVDLFGLWHWSEGQIRKNFWPGAVGDARFYLEAMTKENGTIYDHAEKYKQLSPFNREDTSAGNEQYLRHVPVRLYYDTDIEWQLKNRRNSYYDTKMPDGSELINRLLLQGNQGAEFVPSKQPGLKSNGTRHPASWSIVDEVECIQWIQVSLHIVNAAKVENWAPPYTMKIPKDWTTEHFDLPPDFAPQITYRGIEDLRFSPGWGDVKSDQHWTYGFLWWLEGTPILDAQTLQSNLQAYYSGLIARNIESRKIPAEKIVPTVVSIKQIYTASQDVATFNGTISMLDYHSQLPIKLHCVIHVKFCNQKDRLTVYFAVSPKPSGNAVWRTLDDIGKSIECGN